MWRTFLSPLHPISFLLSDSHHHFKATIRNHSVPALSCSSCMNWSPHFLYCNLATIKPVIRLNEIMFERQLTQCLAYGKCSINDSSYNDGGDKEGEGIMKDYGDDVSSPILSSHLKKAAICPPRLSEMGKLVTVTSSREGNYLNPQRIFSSTTVSTF